MWRAEYCIKTGCPAVPARSEANRMERIAGFNEVYPVAAGDFASAGEVSGRIKRIMKQLGLPSQIVRRASVATYEVELNLVIHSYGGNIELDISSSELKITARDTGPGIPDISLAMQEGYSTASEEARSMGFGAGMGLPNMQRNASEFDIQSTVGVGTTIKMRFSLE